MPRVRAVLFLLPALVMGGLLVHDLARPARTLGHHGTPVGPAADLSDLPARALDWSGPLARLRGWAEASGVHRVDLLLALLGLALLAAAAASWYGFWRGAPGSGGRAQWSPAPPGGTPEPRRPGTS